MNLSDLLEDGNKDLVIIYPGRFHPFHIGHGKVYKYLKQKYSNAKVFISTSGKVDGDRSPFTFEEKRKMMILAGVSSSDIVQTKSPYQSIEIMERFDKDKTVVVFAVSEKDMAEDPRFDFSNGLKLKKNGEPAYLQKWNSLDDAETFGTRGYIATTPTFKFKVLGQEINSASQIRNMIAKSDDTKLTQMLQDLYSVTDVPQDIIDLFKNKVGNKETMNENWDENSFSKFLKENVIEDNIMKTGILKTITEGKSPHKKGTKKYNAHMAAMHAESIDEEFDRKVKEVVELKKTNEWVQDSPAQGFSGQERNFIQELCLRMDGVSKTPNGLQWQGKSKTWDEGNVLSDKGKLTTVMLWAKKNIDDLYHKMGSEFQVYSDGNDEGDSGRGQSDGNQIIQNIINKVGKIGEEVAEAQVLAHGGKGQYKAVSSDGVVRIMYKGKEIASGDFDSGADGWFVSREGDKGQKFFGNAQDMVDHFAENIHAKTNEEKEELNEFWPAVAAAASRIPPNTYATAATAVGAAASKAGKWIKKKLRNSVDHNLKEDYANEQHEQLEYIHHVLQECGDGNMDITMVEQAIEYVEDIREQHFNADGSTKSESVNEEEVSVDNEGNIAGYLDTIDEYVVMLFNRKYDLNKASANTIAYRIQNAVDDIRTRELGLKPSNIRSQYNEDEDDFDEGVMGTIGQGIDNAVVGAGKLIKKGAKAAAPHVKKAAVQGAKKISKIGSKNTTTSFDGKGGSTTSVAYNEDDMKDVTPAGYGPDDYDEKDVPPEAHGGNTKKMQDLYRHNEDRNNHSGNIEMLAQAFGTRDEVKAIEGLMKIIRRQGHVTSEQNDLMYNAIHKKYYSQLFPAENEGNAFSGELAKAKIDGKKQFDVDGKTYKVKEALSKLLDNQKMK